MEHQAGKIHTALEQPPRIPCKLDHAHLGGAGARAYRHNQNLKAADWLIILDQNEI